MQATLFRFLCLNKVSTYLVFVPINAIVHHFIMDNKFTVKKVSIIF